MKKNLKKFFMQFLIPFLGFILVMAPAATGLSQIVSHIVQIGPAVAGAVIVAFAFASFLLNRHSEKIPAIRMGVEVELWVQYIIDRFWKDNQFLQYAFSDDDKVLAGKIVHIPQPGALPEVVKNRTVYPAVAVTRTDTDVTYTLDVYTTTPTKISNAEKVELSYDKINSVYGDHAGGISQTVADNMILTWLSGLPQANYYYTTGDAIDAIAGATGTRKQFTYKDVNQIQRKMNKDNVPKDGRYILVSSDMLQQFKDSLSDTAQNSFNQFYNEATGVMGKFAGFTFFERSEVAYATTDSGTGDTTISAFGAEIGDDTNDVAIAWQKDCVARAMGEVVFFANTDQALYHGDLYSALMRMGGRRRRSDDKGVIAIVQTWVS